MNFNKNRFCGDCKLKVIRAFNALIGELDPAKEKGFNASLYNGIQHCVGGDTGCSYCAAADRVNPSGGGGQPRKTTNKHLRLSCDKQFLMNLILKAEPEIYGSRRERHAKTIEIAQEEVLTCIGVYLYDRFHRIYQSLRVEEQTWQILFHASILTLKKAYELEQEKREGISKLELLCAELDSISCQCGNVTSCGSPRRKCGCQQQQSTGRRKQCAKQTAKQSRNGTKSSMIKSTEQQMSRNDDDGIDEAETESDLDDESKNLNDSNYSSNLSSSNSAKDLDEENSLDQYDDNDDSLIETTKSANTTATSCSLSKLGDLSSTSIGSSDANTKQADSNQSTSNCQCLSLDANDFDSELYSSEFFVENQQFGECCLITDEEKNEYYANKSSLLNERRNRREMLQQRFLNFKMNSSGFKIRPRNVS